MTRRGATRTPTKHRDEMSRAFVFPGQGSQAVGMGKELANAFARARAVFSEVDAAIGQKLSTLMFEGPHDELTLTANAQPAIFAMSLAVVRVLEAEAGLNFASDAHFAAGHSLGEYSALAAAGSVRIAEAARLLRIRGEAMQRAVPIGEGAMAALLGVDYNSAAAIANQASSEIGEGAVCSVANDNGGGQVVISGMAAAVHRAIEIAKAQGVRRPVLLPVSAPFHCALMQPAADAMAEALAAATIKPPCIPIVSNVLAKPVSDPEEIRRLLVLQVTAPVRWRESVEYMVGQGVDTFFECGAGKVLSGLTKRIASTARTLNAGTPAEIGLYRSAA